MIWVLQLYVCVCVCVMFLNISQLLTANYLITHKVLPTASPIYFHQKCTILVCVLEDIVMPFPYAQTTFVNARSFIPRSLFCFLWSVSMHCFSHCTTFAFVICLLIKRYQTTVNPVIYSCDLTHYNIMLNSCCNQSHMRPWFVMLSISRIY